MVLTETIKKLLEAVADEDIEGAKDQAEFLLRNDNNSKNKGYINYLLPRLECRDESIPEEISGKVILGDTGTFNESRYYLRASEQAVLDELIEMQQASAEMQRIGINYFSSAILYGPPGTGKTLFANFLAYKTELPLITINFGQLINSKLGKTGNNIDLIFKYVHRYKCILFIDELDAIGSARGNDNTGEIDRTLLVLLQNLDRIKNNSIVVAATNRIDILDPALLRRFCIQHEIKSMEKEDIYKMVKKYIKSTGYKYRGPDLEEFCKNIYHDLDNDKIIKHINSRLIKAICDKKDYITLVPEKILQHQEEGK